MVDSGTTDASGMFTLHVPVAGSYQLTISKATFTTVVLPVTANCDGMPIELTISMGASVTFVVNGCGCVLPGATVAIAQTAGGSYAASGVTDVSGVVVFYLPVTPGSAFAYTISAPLYQTAVLTSGTLTGSTCTFNIGHHLTTDPGYMCYGGTPPYCRDPIPPSVTLTIAAGVHAGSHTMPYIGESTGLGGYGYEICLAGGTSLATSTALYLLRLQPV